MWHSCEALWQLGCDAREDGINCFLEVPTIGRFFKAFLVFFSAVYHIFMWIVIRCCCWGHHLSWCACGLSTRGRDDHQTHIKWSLWDLNFSDKHNFLHFYWSQFNCCEPLQSKTWEGALISTSVGTWWSSFSWVSSFTISQPCSDPPWMTPSF